MKNERIVIATRDDDGYLTLWDIEANLTKWKSMEYMCNDMYWRDLIGDMNVIESGWAATNMLGGTLLGLRKGRKKLFKITVEGI